MTNVELLKRLLDVSLQKYGENASSVRTLREQLAHAQEWEKLGQDYHQFHIGGWGQPEDADPLEDMYGNRIPSELERAEAEEEEEKRQEEECANRARRRP